MSEVIFKVSPPNKPFCLYRSDVNRDIPSDAIPITLSRYNHALNIDASAYVDGMFVNNRVVLISWDEIREKRNALINMHSFEYEKNSREKRLLMPLTRSDEWMEQLDVYLQALADIPQKFKTPDQVVWPSLSEEL